MGIRLLFADDSATMQKVIQLALEHEDVNLTITGDGESAFEAAKRETPDIILADVYMPGVDGFSLCRKVKANASTAHIPVVLITGEMEEYDDKKGEEAGAASHITKPFKSGELLGTIRKLVDSAPGAAEKPAMLELQKTTASADSTRDDEDMEAVAIDSETLGDADDLELNLDDLDLQDLDAGFSPYSNDKGVGKALDSGVAEPPQINEVERNLSDAFESNKPASAMDLDGLDTPESGDELWNNTLRDLGRDAEVDKAVVEMSSSAVMEEPIKSSHAEPSVKTGELERIFRESADKAVKEFMTWRAPEIFREEMSKAIAGQVGGIIEIQYEKAFRDEISKMIAESFGRAMPKMLGIMEKITLQITPKIAEQIIKTAIDQIKGGEIN